MSDPRRAPLDWPRTWQTPDDVLLKFGLPRARLKWGIYATEVRSGQTILEALSTHVVWSSSMRPGVMPHVGNGGIVLFDHVLQPGEVIEFF